MAGSLSMESTGSQPALRTTVTRDASILIVDDEVQIQSLQRLDQPFKAIAPTIYQKEA